MGINYGELFNNSYARILPNDKGDRFFTHFYTLFTKSSDDEKSPLSVAQRLDKQKIIYKTFFYMLSVANTHIVADYLVQITRESNPQNINLPPSAYALWRRAVLQTVRDLDPKCDEEIITAWAIILAPGLEFMRRQAELFHKPPTQEGSA
ncbi:Globin [Hafnia paralvei]|uniref:Globin n=1 Tax=Hafnia paralvei TaxID=546367 RepID=UPI0024BAD4D5|nr:Globin [Hafnia paralvei]